LRGSIGAYRIPGPQSMRVLAYFILLHAKILIAWCLMPDAVGLVRS
jgi:hypothetical protein